MDQRRQQGASRRQGASRGLGLGQLLSGDGPGGAVWRLQDERLWPRVRQAASGRVSQRQGGLDQDGLGWIAFCFTSPRKRGEVNKSASIFLFNSSSGPPRCRTAAP